jgi:hypothetical protein
VSELKVFLGGEGNDELGSRCGDPVYQSDESPGVIETLLRRVRSRGWKVIGACKWCDIRKLRAKGPSPNDRQNVLGLVLDAKRSGADVLAFTRDEDGDKQRPRVISDAVQEAQRRFPAVAIVGAAAVPVLEGWILALIGERRTENVGKAAAQKRLVDKGIDNTRAMVEAVENADIRALPEDATSLRGWLASAEKALPGASIES